MAPPFVPKNPAAFQELLSNFPPHLRPYAWTFFDLALMRCQRISKEGGLSRGQFYYGREEIEKVTGITPQTLRTIENRLEVLQEFTRKSTNKGSVGTLLNIDTYIIDGNEINKPATNQQQTSNNSLKEKEKEKKKEPFVASNEAVKCLKAWEQYRPIIEQHRKTYHKAIDDLHTLDKLPWEGEEGIFAICAFAVKEWTASMIQAPSKLRKPSKQYPELKTWQVIQGQIRDYHANKASTNGKPPALQVVNEIMANAEQQEREQASLLARRKQEAGL